MTQDTSQPPDAAAVDLLSFRLGPEEYSLDIMSVREIRGWTRATPLPHAPAFMRGVINLRGTVLPVIDLSARLGMAPVTADARAVIIVVQRGAQTAGLLVDAVCEILNLRSTELQPPPDLSKERPAPPVSAFTIFEGRMIRVLDLAGVLSELGSEAA